MNGHGSAARPETGVLVHYDEPGLARGAVVGAVTISCAECPAGLTVIVRNGVPVPADLPASTDYVARGLRASGGWLTGHARGECREGRANGEDGDGRVTLRLTAAGDTASEKPTPRFWGDSWVAGFEWNMRVRGYRPARGALLVREPQALRVVADEAPDVSLVQVSEDGRPPRFIARPPREGLLLARERAVADSNLADVLLSFLQTAEPAATGAVADEAAAVAHAEPDHSFLLDLALAYYYLQIGSERCGRHVARLLKACPDSCDAYVIRAWLHLRRSPPQFVPAATLLEHAVQCGLPAATRGLQLLTEGLHIVPRDASLIETITPYAISAHADSVLTTFWGATPDAPLPAPLLARAPAHAAVLADPAGRRRGPEPIARASAEIGRNVTSGLARAVSGMVGGLADVLALASELALAADPDQVEPLALALGDALRRSEAAGSVQLSRIAQRLDSVRLTIEAQQRMERNRNLTRQLTRAIETSRRRLRVIRQDAARAGTGPARGRAMRDVTAYAADLAIDTRDALDVFAGAQVRLTDAVVASREETQFSLDHSRRAMDIQAMPFGFDA